MQTTPPQLISRPPKKIFPRATAAAKILTSLNQIFIFSESLDPQDHFGTNSSRIHPVLTKKILPPGNDSIDLIFIA